MSPATKPFPGRLCVVAALLFVLAAGELASAGALVSSGAIADGSTRWLIGWVLLVAHAVAMLGSAALVVWRPTRGLGLAVPLCVLGVVLITLAGGIAVPDEPDRLVRHVGAGFVAWITFVSAAVLSSLSFPVAEARERRARAHPAPHTF